MRLCADPGGSRHDGEMGRAIQRGPPRPVNGDIEHTEAVYLVDRRGYMRSGYQYPFASGYVTSDLRTLTRTRGD